MPRKLKSFFKSPNWRTFALWTGAIIVGCVAYALGFCAEHAFEFFSHMAARFWWWPFISLSVGGIALTWFMGRVGPGTEGSGIQQAIAAMKVTASPERTGWFVNLRLASAKFVAIVAGMGSGFVLGLEGPTVQIGASILYSFRRFIPTMNAVVGRQLIMAGGAAGIAAAFNAPFAGVMFAFEEMGKHICWHASMKVVLGVILAGTAAFVLRGRHNVFGQVDMAATFDPHLLLILLGVAIAGGLAGTLFSWLAIRTAKWIPEPVQRFRMKHPYYFVIICALLIALCGLIAPIYGSGMGIAGQVMRGEASIPWYYFPLKLFGLIATMQVGVPGGVFAPSLSMGAGVGSWFLTLGESAWQGEIIAIGMVSVLAAVTRSPLTAAFIVVEMTKGSNICLEALAAALIASHIARFGQVKFYHELADRAMHSLPERLKIDPGKEAPPKDCADVI